MTKWNPYALRLAPGLKERLEQEAKRNGRSLNAEINQRLQRSLDAYRLERVRA